MKVFKSYYITFVPKSHIADLSTFSYCLWWGRMYFFFICKTSKWQLALFFHEMMPTTAGAINFYWIPPWSLSELIILLRCSFMALLSVLHFLLIWCRVLGRLGCFGNANVWFNRREVVMKLFCYKCVLSAPCGGSL